MIEEQIPTKPMMGINVGDFTQDRLIQYAKTLDPGMQEFESYLSEGKRKGTVEQDAVQAEAADVCATPMNSAKTVGTLFWKR